MALSGLTPEEQEMVKGWPDDIAKGFIEARRKQENTGFDFSNFLDQVFKKPGSSGSSGS